MLPVTSANGDEPAIARLHAAPAQPLQLASGVGALPSIEVADALLDERREMSEWATTRRARSSTDTGPARREDKPTGHDLLPPSVNAGG